ncbi:MAG: hypothetical protein JXB03_01865, partial [Spirochaetales bacterium]|nr:hypothetical protein [Spirochaetales bacterium]
ISGFWSEKDEYALVSEVSVDCYGRSLRIKPLYLQFYETGELESIALWPSDRLSFETPVGPLTVRNGIAFYKNGKLRSVEPSVPAAVSTGIGTLTAFHPDPDGVCAETASLSFSTSGEVTALSTSASTVEVTRADGTQKLYAPVQVKSMCSDLATAVAPLKICFADKAVVFGRGHTVIGSEPLSGSFSIGVYAPVMENSETCTDECLPDYSFRA